jgi:hypothetical protein
MVIKIETSTHVRKKKVINLPSLLSARALAAQSWGMRQANN